MYARSMAFVTPLLCIALAGTVISCGGRGDSAAGEGNTTAGAQTSNVRVTDVTLGRGVGTDRRITDQTTEFRSGDTIYASVVTEGTANSVTLTARWTFEDGQVVDESSRTVSPSGTEVTEFHISNPQGWPRGRYQVEVRVDGSASTTREFEVR